MTFETMYEELLSQKLSPFDAAELVDKNKSTVNYFVHKDKINSEPLSESELNKLNALVKVLQYIYNSNVASPVSDQDYDILQELLVNYGYPRLTGSPESSSLQKGFHLYPNLRGTLNKIYYLYDEDRLNKSQKSIWEWIKTIENKVYRKTGKKIYIDGAEVLLTPKFDGTSAIMEIDNGKVRWLTRGDTELNEASDISHIMLPFNERFKKYDNCGIKFEIMCSEENLARLNEVSEIKYKNSRQVVASTLNQVEMDYKVKYLTPIPLRIMHKGDSQERIFLEEINYPVKETLLADVDEIGDFADENKYVIIDGERFRTDGVVITILDSKENIKCGIDPKVIGRENNINDFEVAYKFTTEYAYSRVRDVEFYISEFGFITPVVVFNPVVLKGNTVQKASLSNKERFDELNLHYGDTVRVSYDIIPYISIDKYCREQNK